MLRSALPMACLTLLGFASCSVAALEFPNPPQPEAQALIKRFQADYARIKTDPNYFKPPAAPMVMPCEVPQIDLYMPLGLYLAIPEEVEKMRLMGRKTLRDLGMDPDADNAASDMKYNNIRITPIKAACKNGKLDGEAEFLVQFDTLMENVNTMDLGAKQVRMTMKMATQQISRYFLSFKDGKALEVEKYHANQLAMRNETLYDDAQVTQSMAKSKVPDAPEPQVSLTYMNPLAGRMTVFTVSMAPKFSASVFGMSTTFQQQLDSHFTTGINQSLYRMDMYKNDKLFMTSETPMKNDKYHGEQVQVQENYLKAPGMRLDQMPGMERARLVTVNGVEMLETRNCYVAGVMTKVQTCPKD